MLSMRALYRGLPNSRGLPGLPTRKERCILMPASKGDSMKTKKALYLGVAAIALAALLTACLSTQGTGGAGANDIAGVVTGPNGPEAGVWVVAETNDLPTKYAKLVVTDDQGRYLIPDLPKGNYSVWVRGYGLVDSPKVSGTAGRTLNLTADRKSTRLNSSHLVI